MEMTKKGKTKDKRIAGYLKGRREYFFPLSIAVFLIIACLVGACYQVILEHYRENLVKETAAHLSEINNQMKNYTEEEIEKGWKIARSAADDLENHNYQDSGDSMANDEKVLGNLRNKKEIWGISDISVYTEEGYCISVNGAVETNGIASATIYNAKKQDAYMAIFDSNITYTIPVNTETSYRGSRIVAISVIQNLSSYLDDMDLSSYDEHAGIYLTDREGVVISRLTNEETSSAYNIMALLNSHILSDPINTEQIGNDIFDNPSSTVYLMTDQEGKQEQYVVSTPIETHSDRMHLFYLISGSIANETMDSFTRYITLISVFVILIFVVFFAFVYMYIYRLRKREFDDAMIAREHMFELLVSNTQTAFGLFKVGQKRPSYISSNTKEIIGEDFLTLHHAGDSYYMKGDENGYQKAVHQINECMEDWDGRSAFSSGYIKRGEEENAGYYELQLYPTEDFADEYVGIALDVTDAYEREHATKEALIMAENANEAKTRFLSNMSHDIRTPMNAIVNMTGFALENIFDREKLSEYLKTISESAEHLLMLINDILDMSRIESGKSVMEQKPFDLKNELCRLRDIVQPLCDQKKQTLFTDFSEISVSGVIGDCSKVSQIFMNLLSNAVKYTPDCGTIRFIAKETPSLRDNIVDICFMVEDNGMGISREFQEHLFEPFSREDASRISKIQGTGLGLSICHNYVVAMGGSIKCASDENHGSSFTVELFFERAEKLVEIDAQTEDWDQIRFSGKRCLLCEDNVINQMIAQTILERLGFTIDTAADGNEGAERFVQSEDGFYDVIYMDIQMPVMNGYEATDVIRKSHHPQAEVIPIIAMTANVFAEDIEKARMAGMNGHIAKPFEIRDMVIETRKVIREESE